MFKKILTHLMIYSVLVFILTGCSTRIVPLKNGYLAKGILLGKRYTKDYIITAGLSKDLGFHRNNEIDMKVLRKMDIGDYIDFSHYNSIDTMIITKTKENNRKFITKSNKDEILVFDYLDNIERVEAEKKKASAKKQEKQQSVASSNTTLERVWPSRLTPISEDMKASKAEVVVESNSEQAYIAEKHKDWLAEAKKKEAEEKASAFFGDKESLKTVKRVEFNINTSRENASFFNSQKGRTSKPIDIE